MIRNILSLLGIILLLSIPAGSFPGKPLDESVGLFEKEAYAEAKKGFEEVLAADGENHEALYYLGRIALIDEDLDGSIDLLRRAVKLDEKNSIYRTWLGRAYLAKLQTVSFYEKGMLAGRALENLQKAVELDSMNIDARILLGSYYLNAPSIGGGSKKKAREQAEIVVQHRPVEGNAMLAGIHVKNKEYDQAIEKYELCIEAQPGNTEYRYQIGMLYQELERYNESFDAFEQILEIDPDNLGAIYQIGRTAAFSGQNTGRGIECLQMYLEKEVPTGYPGPDGAHWRLGMIYEHKGDVEMARSEYKLAVELNPTENRYAESLEKLDED